MCEVVDLSVAGGGGGVVDTGGVRLLICASWAAEDLFKVLLRGVSFAEEAAGTDNSHSPLDDKGPGQMKRVLLVV